MPPAPDQGRSPAASGSLALLPEIPKQIGPFKILRQIGAGGMGIVFLAQQDRPSRTVALKIVHGSVLSHGMLRRFEQEAELLARLQHPGIAQVFQVGTYATSGGELPYIAMELVEGERLDRYLERQAPPMRGRLELAARIADAVEHAHQKGVIHRDLKPGNILVTADGQPKILDFGVARLADDDTRTSTLRTDVGSLVGTLTYMSPEQASGDPKAIDTRSDVYSLGVLLFEMLTGKLPYVIERAPLAEAVRVIREEEPTKISKHDKALRGDVETIVGKALEKDRTRRYATAQALADDIRRTLVDEPIQARPPSAWYQLSKFAQRNQALVGGIAAVFLTLAVGVGVATTLYVKERAASERERDALSKERDATAREREALAQARVEERRASATAEFLLSLFGGIDPEVALGADTRLLQKILADARGRLAAELADQPEVEAQIRTVLGRAYTQISLFDEAATELRRAVDLWTARFGPDDRRTLRARGSLATVDTRRGDSQSADAPLREVLERQTRLFGAKDADTLHTRACLGDNLMRLGRYREAEETLRAALADSTEVHGADHETSIALCTSLAHVLTFESKLEESYELRKLVHELRSGRLGEDHPDAIIALSSLSDGLRALDRLDEAESAQRRALELGIRVFGPEDMQTLSMRNNLAIVLDRRGRSEEAEALLREVLESRKRLFGPDAAPTLNSLNHLASFLWSRNRTLEAEPLVWEALEKSRRALGDDHVESARAMGQAAMLHARKREYAEAASLFEAIAARDRRVLGEDDPELCLDLYNWAATLQNADDDAGAEPVLRELIALVEEHGHESQRFVPAARNALAKIVDGRGEHDEADALFRAALEERRRRHPPAHPEIGFSLADWGEALLDRGDAEAALPLLEEHVRLRVELAPKDPPYLLPWSKNLHGRCLTKLGRYAEAEALLLSACEALAEMPRAMSAAARETRAGILELYAAWDAAEPGRGIAERAERWREPFPAER